MRNLGKYKTVLIVGVILILGNYDNVTIVGIIGTSVITTVSLLARMSLLTSVAIDEDLHGILMSQNLY